MEGKKIVSVKSVEEGEGNLDAGNDRRRGESGEAGMFRRLKCRTIGGFDSRMTTVEKSVPYVSCMEVGGWEGCPLTAERGRQSHHEEIVIRMFRIVCPEQRDWKVRSKDAM
jgi:hypothetical protein